VRLQFLDAGAIVVDRTAFAQEAVIQLAYIDET
jgi:hypothetical protein